MFKIFSDWESYTGLNFFKSSKNSGFVWKLRIPSSWYTFPTPGIYFANVKGEFNHAVGHISAREKSSKNA